MLDLRPAAEILLPKFLKWAEKQVGKEVETSCDVKADFATEPANTTATNIAQAVIVAS